MAEGSVLEWWFWIVFAAVAGANALHLRARNGGVFPQFGGKRFDWSVGLFLAFVVTANLAATLAYAQRETLIGVYLLAIGSLFVAAYFLADRIVLFGWMMWVCERGYPPSRKMAFFYFALCLFLGLAALNVIDLPRR
jgi:hypothetical protein